MKIIVFMPAYNAEKTLEKTYRDIPKDSVDEIILGDDASTDRTIEIAKSLGIDVVQNEKNMGYGANQKMCYKEALRRGADIIIMLHPDYQYDSRLVPYLAGFIKEDVCDIVLGSRIRTRREVLSGGMPIYKYIFNRFLTVIENLILGQNLAEFHSGFRAFRKDVFLKIPYEINSDDFVFDQQILIQAAYFGFRIGDVPSPTRYFKEASSISFKRSAEYGFGILYFLLLFILQKLRILKFKYFIPKK